MILSWRNFSLNLTARTHIMGVVNTTPDSFSDGGLFFDGDVAVAHALRLVEEGADIIDIGGESTRPGSDPVSPDEELRRTIPVIRAVSRAVSVPVSIDTCKADVAQQALDAGASMVNDISGLRFDPEMADVVARAGVPVIVMHIRGKPKVMQVNPTYGALIPEVTAYLRESIAIAAKAGIPPGMVMIDPGIGFGKTFDHNLQIIRDLGEFLKLGHPVVIGVSRKAFLGKILGDAPPSERLEGTAAAVAISIFNGAHIVRVHDVREMARVARVADAVRRGTVAVLAD
ncbi:MAG TPA: dihydropteroate synthase [Dissulfurispiraceae bacterium]|nr:dihydropteroate synthase [Dissulfurispiraceae bacterium]